MVSSIRLSNFRSYQDAEFEFNDKTNLIIGPNGSGKTNLLEAILVSLRGKSYRAKDIDLVKINKPWARISSTLNNNSLRTVKINTVPVNKTYELDGKTFKQLSLERMVPVVLFEPNHMQLFIGNPSNRRDYLDDLIEQTTPGYKKIRQQYLRTLSQRNNLLKSLRSNEVSRLFPWNIRLSQLAGPMVSERTKLIKRFNQSLNTTYGKLSTPGKTSVELVYNSEIDPDNYESKLIKALDQNLEKDMLRGHTSFGPHRDDLKAMLDGHNIQEVGSRGETRTLILALKFGELEIHEEINRFNPVILLDDVFSELDISRRKKLLNRVKDYQSFITTTDIDSLDKNLKSRSKTIKIT